MYLYRWLIRMLVCFAEVKNSCVHLPAAPTVCVDVEAQNCTQFVRGTQLFLVTLNHSFLFFYYISLLFYFNMNVIQNFALSSYAAHSFSSLL